MNWNSDQIPDLRGKISIVTGGNTGIGFETVKALAEKNAKVVLACRNQDKGTAALAKIRSAQPDADVSIEMLDLASQKSVHAFGARINEQLPHIDILINNAGVMEMPLTFTEDGFEGHFATNVLGHFTLTGLLLPLLNKAPAANRARVVTLSSAGHWIGKLDFDNLNAEKGFQRTLTYAGSKLANLVFAYELQRRLVKNGMRTESLGAHPGVTHSDLGRNKLFTRIYLGLFGQSAADGALPSLRAAADPDVHGGDYLGPGGFMTFFGPPTVQKSRKLARDPELGRRLWDAMQKMTGLSYLYL